MAAPTLEASGTVAAVTSGTLTVTLPTHQAGDILVVVTMAWLPNSTGTAVTTAPTDWAKADNVTQIATTIDAEYAIFWLRATASGTTNPVFTRPTGWDTGTDGVWSGRAYVIRGCAPTGDPWDQLAKSGPHTTLNQAFPAVTVSGSERHVIQFLSKADNNGGVTAASGWTVDTIANSSTGTDSSHQTIRKENVSSSTTADTATIAASANAGSAYVFFGASFKPADPTTITGTESVSASVSDTAQLSVHEPSALINGVESISVTVSDTAQLTVTSLPPVTITGTDSVSATVSDVAALISLGTPTAPLTLAGSTGSNGAVNLTWSAPTGIQ